VVFDDSDRNFDGNGPRTGVLVTSKVGSLTEFLTLPDQTVIMPGSTVRWLGIYFDRSLSFKDHVFIRTSQARSAFFRMCRLANSERGLSPYALRQLYLACITSIVNYGCQIYWKGQSFFNSKLQTLQNMAFRKILGTFHTAPTLPSEVEAALPPPAIRLDSILSQYAFRIYKLPFNHSLKEASRAIEAQLYPNPGSDLDSDATETSEQRLTSKMLEGSPRQLQRIIESIHNVLFPQAEQIIHHNFRPWEKQAPYNTTLSQHS
jgi:hypothetical protein